MLPERKLYGILMGAFSSLLFAIMAILVQQVSKDIPVQQTSFIRGFVSCLFLLPFIFKSIPQIAKPISKSLWTRSIFGAIAVTCYFWNTGNGSAAEAKALANTSPLFVAIMSWFLYKERLTFKEVVGLVVLISGAFILVHDIQTNRMPLIWIIGTIGAVFTGGAYLSLKRASGKFDHKLIVFTFSSAIMLVSAITPSAPWSMPHGIDLLWLILVGLCGLIAQISLTISHLHLKNAIASSLTLLTTVFLIIYDIVWTQQIKSLGDLTSYALILLGMSIMVGKTKGKQVSSGGASLIPRPQDKE